MGGGPTLGNRVHPIPKASLQLGCALKSISSIILLGERNLETLLVAMFIQMFVDNHTETADNNISK